MVRLLPKSIHFLKEIKPFTALHAKLNFDEEMQSLNKSTAFFERVFS